jgi:hypothetical protein
VKAGMLNQQQRGFSTARKSLSNESYATTEVCEKVAWDREKKLGPMFADLIIAATRRKAELLLSGSICALASVFAGETFSNCQREQIPGSARDDKP